MNPERWRRIEELYQSAQKHEPGVRGEFLKGVCAGDRELLADVEALLTRKDSPKRESEDELTSENTAPLVTGLSLPGAGLDRDFNLTTVTTTLPGMLGTRLANRYRVVSEIGRGGFATVYLANDEKLASKPVVIKVLHTQKVDRWRLRKFRQEMEALARIDHPGVVAVLDEGQTSEGAPFLVIQFVDGVTLRSFVRPHGLDVRRAADLVRQIGSALQAAHAKDVLHRDLKPENIMIQTVDANDRVKLIDFGIASVAGSPHATRSQSTRIAGTQGYMAPEQFEGKACAESDIFAFGAIAYELLTGQRPIESPLDLADLRREGLRIKPRDLRPEIPESAEAIILKSLSYEPGRRYHDARDMGDQLARALVSAGSKGGLNPRDLAVVPDAEPLSDHNLELAHVVFLDLVGYSLMDMETQRQSLEELHQVIWSAPHFVEAERAGDLIALPTGDGMALLFFGDPTRAAECALEISRAARQRPILRMRMGLNSGPVYRVADINQRTNAAGGGINVAQRVMDAGDSGHILVSAALADVLRQFGSWKRHLTDFGEHPVKHDVVIHFYNLCTADAGNAAWPSRWAKSRSKVTRRAIGILTLALFLALLVSVLYLRNYKALASINSIAVLPITNLSADPNWDYMSDGITETLINNLSKFPTLQVMSRSAVFRGRATQASPLDQGRALHVNTILTGTLREISDQIDLNVELVDVGNGRQLWGERYRGPSSDLLRIQQTAVAAVANQLRARLNTEKQVTKDYTANVDAYRLYLKGRYEWNKRTMEGYLKSAEYFREAIGQDPTYALAYSGVADAYSFRSGLRKADEIFPIARAAAMKAVELDNSLAEGHASLAFILLQYDWDWGGVERELRKALELNPNYASAHSMYGRLLTATGRFPAAEKEFLKAQQLDPLSMGTANGLAFHYYLSRKFDLAEKQFQRNLTMDPAFGDTQSLLAYTFVEENRLREAIRKYELLLAKNPDDLGTLPDLARAYALAGRRNDSLHLLAHLQEITTNEYVIPTLFAEVYAALGDYDSAFKYLDRAYRERTAQLIFLNVEPVWDPLRKDTRFQQLLKQMKLL